MPRMKCEGWWEQVGYGRQVMEQLFVDFHDSSLSGSGHDVVGTFRIDGQCHADRVAIVKQYVGRHRVKYVGTTDGEGVYRGDWQFDTVTGGRWLIRATAFDDRGTNELPPISIL